MQSEMVARQNEETDNLLLQAAGNAENPRIRR